MSLAQINWRSSRRICRQFGFGGLVILGLLGVWVSWRSAVFGVAMSSATSQAVAIALWLAAAALGLLALAAPQVLRWPFVVLSLIALPVGWVLSHLLLAVLYYGVFTVAGLAMRLLRRDPLARRFEPLAGTYWVPCRQASDPSRYFRQS